MIKKLQRHFVTTFWIRLCVLISGSPIVVKLWTDFEKAHQSLILNHIKTKKCWNQFVKKSVDFYKNLSRKINVAYILFYLFFWGGSFFFSQREGKSRLV